MAYVRLAPLALFLLATSCIHVYICSNFAILFLVMFTPKKINAENCGSLCSLFTGCSSKECVCWPEYLPPTLEPTYVCIHVKMADQNPSLCQSHDECIKNGSGNFCARHPNPGMDYGMCVNSGARKDFLKMPTASSE
ncbi:hypothetical protein CR513_21992, partial [Mucuna pruriens]